MNAVPGLVALELLEAPFRIPNRIARLGPSLWLYVRLITIANSSGRVCRTTNTLAHDMDVAESELGTWVTRLAAAGLLEVQNPAPYLVLKLRLWPSMESKSQESSDVQPRAPAPLGGSSKLLHASAAENEKSKQAGKHEDGGPGEGEALLPEVLGVLGTTEQAKARDLIARYPGFLVRRALRRVEITPADQIRKSRLALFRYLLAKFANDLHDRHPSNPT